MLASSLVYFSPTRRGPMPGSRTEAMLSGCCVVSVPGHDWEHHVQDGVNGFIVRDYKEARGVLKDLLAQPRLAYEVGQAGRALARSRFEHKRFVNQWLAMLTQIGVTI